MYPTCAGWPGNLIIYGAHRAVRLSDSYGTVCWLSAPCISGVEVKVEVQGGCYRAIAGFALDAGATRRCWNDAKLFELPSDIVKTILH